LECPAGRAGRSGSQAISQLESDSKTTLNHGGITYVLFIMTLDVSSQVICC